MKVAVRVDSATQIGSGHVVRTLTLANELRRRGTDITFFCRALPGNMVGLIQSSEFLVKTLAAPSENSSSNLHDEYSRWLGVSQEQDAADTIAAMGKADFDCLIVDHYALSETWEQLLRAKTRQLMVVDDLANRPHDCDLLLDQNFYGDRTPVRYQNLVGAHTKLLLGPEYALLQPDYASQRSHLQNHSGELARVFVFFGGSDPFDLTGLALRVLSEGDWRHLVLDVVIGQNHPDPAKIEAMIGERTNAVLHRQLPSLASLIAEADLAIGAGGATSWERLCLGVPSLVVTMAENQVATTRDTQEAGLVRWLGNADAVGENDLRLALQAVRERGNLAEWSARCLQMCDGSGTLRVVDSLMGLNEG